MTNKEQFIHNLHQARVDVIRWSGAIKLLSADLPMKDYTFELNLFDTDFGKWFYEEASLITSVNSIDIIDNIEDILTPMHANFMNIYEVCVLHRKKTFLGTTKALDGVEKNMAFTYYQEVIRLSDEFQKLLRRFERIMKAKSEEEFTMFAHAVEAKASQMKKVEQEIEIKKEENISIGGARGAYFHS
jgi:hypothetical protein